MAYDKGRQTAHEFVRETLRSQILSGELVAGSRLVQSDVAHQLNVSTTPVREALRDLATEGLIKLDAHRGAVIHRASRYELEEIYRLRRLLEPEAVRRSMTRLTEEDLLAAEEIQTKADEEEDPSKWTDLNREFHAVFMRVADSPRLASMVATLQDAAAIYVVTSILHGRDHHHPGHHHHWDLIKACRAGDEEEAVRIMQVHIDETLDALIGGQSGSAPSGRRVRP